MKMTQFHIRGYQGHNVLSCYQHTAILKKKISESQYGDVLIQTKTFISRNKL